MDTTMTAGTMTEKMMGEGMMEPAMMGGMSMPGMGMMGSMPGMGMMPGMMGGMGMMMPRCTMSMEKCEGGMQMMCMASDDMAAAMMQNLCTMMSGGMPSLCMMMNGMMVMGCNMTMAMCKFEMTAQGMMMTCTSGDAMMARMIQACCDAMMSMMECGCTACLCMNGMPVCCSK